MEITHIQTCIQLLLVSKYWSLVCPDIGENPSQLQGLIRQMQKQTDNFCIPFWFQKNLIIVILKGLLHYSPYGLRNYILNLYYSLKLTNLIVIQLLLMYRHSCIDEKKFSLYLYRLKLTSLFLKVKTIFQHIININLILNTLKRHFYLFTYPLYMTRYKLHNSKKNVELLILTYQED